MICVFHWECQSRCRSRQSDGRPAMVKFRMVASSADKPGFHFNPPTLPWNLNEWASKVFMTCSRRRTSSGMSGKLGSSGFATPAFVFAHHAGSVLNKWVSSFKSHSPVSNVHRSRIRSWRGQECHCTGMKCNLRNWTNFVEDPPPGMWAEKKRLGCKSALTRKFPAMNH